LKALIVIVLLVIIGSLGQALYYLFHDRERSPRTVRALTMRIGLSIGLFLLLLLAFSLGWIKPHGLRPSGPPPATDSSAPASPAR
jgi:drug/metabolite transporter (DMT)-like permease